MAQHQSCKETIAEGTMFTNCLGKPQPHTVETKITIKAAQYSINKLIFKNNKTSVSTFRKW